MKPKEWKDKVQYQLERICALATEIEESPSTMGWEDIDRLVGLHDAAKRAIKLLRKHAGET